MPDYVSYVTYVVHLFMRRVSAAHDDFMIFMVALLRALRAFVVISFDYRAPLHPGNLNPPMRVE
jgi:hypothetical protein